MSTCEFCGGEYKNISVHQRFCKAKKEALEKSDEFSNTLSIEEAKNLVTETNVTPTDKEVKIVEEAMQNIVEKENIQVAPVFKQETSIEFNEDKDNWQSKLIQIFESMETGSTINIKLKNHLSHEFSEQFGVYRYPSDVFIQILRDNCESWEDITNDVGGQTYICKCK